MNFDRAYLLIGHIPLAPVAQSFRALAVRLVRKLGVDHRIPNVGVPEVLLDVHDALMLLRKQQSPAGMLQGVKVGLFFGYAREFAVPLHQLVQPPAGNPPVVP